MIDTIDPPSVDVVSSNRSTAILTDKGHAVLAAYRLLRALARLGADDRRSVLEMLALELGELPPIV